MHFYLLRYLFVHLAPGMLSGSGLAENSRVPFFPPLHAPNPLRQEFDVSVTWSLSRFLRTWSLTERVTHAMLSQQGTLGERDAVKPGADPLGSDGSEESGARHTVCWWPPFKSQRGQAVEYGMKRVVTEGNVHGSL